eukprot:jgi/Botrbrau1/12331/Bobra.4_3s0003.1
MHRPASLEDFERARRRIAFDELLALQLRLLLRRQLLRTPASDQEGGCCISQMEAMRAGLAALPFELTGAQQAALRDILSDMLGPAPMLRLLQGDVGCGKTAVAFLALLAAAGSNFQAALMAPTEVLAEQHAAKLEELLEAMPEDLRPTCALLTGRMRGSKKKEVYGRLEAGSLDIVIGTHALISETVSFKRLGLVIIDEQHRFGVEQRAQLAGKSNTQPHVLAMTATPIPRTLALAVHGDMALCAINEMPPGRTPVDTRVVFDPSEDDPDYHMSE